ncbi:MAG: hypothetical protein SF029_24400 [bacterium]|nr:hypothetical protein [bacterium]
MNSRRVGFVVFCLLTVLAALIVPALRSAFSMSQVVIVAYGSTPLPVPPSTTTAATPLIFPPTATLPPLIGYVPTEALFQPLPTLPPPTAPVLASNRTTLNGVLLESDTSASGAILVMPPNVQENVRRIYALGQSLGRNPRAFSKLGDCNAENPHFLARFDDPRTGYNLGDYADLQWVIDTFSGSFGRQGVAVHRGLHSWSVFDPMWADSVQCAAGEHVLACELRLNNPAFLLIRLGTNDVGVPDSYERNMRRVIEVALENGVVPILGTKADRRDGVIAGGDSPNNAILRRLAEEYAVPLWDFDRIAATLPGRGLDNDGAHMTTYYSHDYRDPVAFQRAHALQNLTALLALDRVLRAALGEV